MASGSVRRKDGAWSFRVDIGPDPGTGRRRQVLRQGFATKKAAEAALQDVLHAAGRGSLPTPSRLSLGPYLEGWLATQSGRLQPTTMRSYEIAARRIVRHIGHVSLQALTPLQIESFYTELARSDKAERALAPKSIRNIHIVLRKALADAERLGQVARNSAAAAKAPTPRRHEYATWTSEDVRDFFAATSDHRLRRRVRVARHDRDAPRRGPRTAMVRRRSRRWPASGGADTHHRRLRRHRERAEDAEEPTRCLPRSADRRCDPAASTAAARGATDRRIRVGHHARPDLP